MSFFFNETKAAPTKAKPKARLRDIPVRSLNSLGCGACPRDSDASLKAPKMAPHGSKNPLVYILTSAPTREEDAEGYYMSADHNQAILRRFPERWDRRLRFGAIIQCGSDSQYVDPVEAECCRNRVISDIEKSKPLVIMGIGDSALAWATGLDAYAPKFRGRLIPVKIGTHVCFYYPVLFPNWHFKEKGKKSYGKSPHELSLEHDIRNLVEMVDREELPANEYFTGDPYQGIEVITGQEAGDFQRLERALADLSLERRVGCDLETNGLRPLMLKDPHIWMAAVGTFERTVAFSLEHPEGWGTQHQQRKVWELFAEWLLFSGIKECHNLAMEMEWFGWKLGTRILRLTEWDDTMSMAHTIDERPGTKGLEVQGTLCFGLNIKALSNIDPKRIVEYPIRKALIYNALDSKWTNRISRFYRPLLAANPAFQWEHDRKVRLAPALVCTELRGLPVDLDYAEKMRSKFQKMERDALDKIRRTPEVRKFEQRFGTFKPSNSDDVVKLMETICDRDEIRREDPQTGKIKITVDEEALQEIPARDVPSAPLILEWRGAAKQNSTYIEPVLSGRVISTDGRIHSKYSSMTAVTTRLAGEEPNPQNWPKRKHREIRGIVAAGRGKWILAADYGQIEFRVVGMCSEDDNLVKYCWTKYDVHGHWAGRMLKSYPPIFDSIVERFEINTKDKNVDVDKVVLKTLRQEAKNGWVFPQFFGSSVKSCATQLFMPLDVMEDLAAEFWDEFPGVKKWQDKLMRFYERHLYVETLSGARRRGAMTKNEIINMPIQGTAAHIVCAGMVALDERAMLEEDEDLGIILNVHDDLSSEPRDSDIERVIPIVAEEMCKHRFPYINVPLVVEVSAGHRWSELEHIADFRSDEIFKLRNPYA